MPLDAISGRDADSGVGFILDGCVLAGPHVGAWAVAELATLVGLDTAAGIAGLRFATGAGGCRTSGIQADAPLDPGNSGGPVATEPSVRLSGFPVTVAG